MHAERIRRATASVLAWSVAVIAALPLLLVCVGGTLNSSALGTVSEQWVAERGGGTFTTGWVAYVLETYAPMLRFSVEVALSTALAAAVIGVPAAYAFARSRSRWARALEEVALVPLALPGLAMSVALIQTYSRVRGSVLLIVGGHLLYTVPLLVRTVTLAFRGSDIARLEAAAASLGADFVQRLRFVVLPSAWPSIVTGSLLVIAVSWGEFNVSYLLTTPLHQTFPAALYATYTFNSFQVSSAATLVFLSVLVPLLVLMQWRWSSATPVQGA